MAHEIPAQESNGEEMEACGEEARPRLQRRAERPSCHHRRGPPYQGGERRPADLGVTFSREPKRLVSCLTHVWVYMLEDGAGLPTEGLKLQSVTLVLEGSAAKWMVALHNGDAPELRNFTWFTAALRKRSEDPLVDQKAKTRIKAITPGRGPVAAYT